MVLFPGNIDDLKSLYITELRYLRSTEKQTIKALPKMMEAVNDQQLKQALQTHLQETKEHARRLDTILHHLTFADEVKKCAVASALIRAGETTIKAANDKFVRDAGIIAATQSIEHFEIASYGSARAWAAVLGETQHVQLLQQTLQEEEHADQLLTTISETLNPAAKRAA